MTKLLPTVRLTVTGTTHAVHAAGGPLDGSLHGFVTLCGLTITDAIAWQEIEPAEPSCRRCLRGYIPWAEGGR